MLAKTLHTHLSGVAIAKFRGGAKNLGRQNADFRQATVFCLEYRF